MNTPMLLKNFEDSPVRYPVWCERKHDGIRCVILVDELGHGSAWSRYGRPLPAAQLLADAVAAVMPAGHVVDCELCGETWSATQSSVKRRDPAGLRLWAFDCLTEGEWTAGGTEAHLMQRRGRLDPLRDAAGVEVIDGVYAFSESKLGELFMDAVANQWEGLCIKDLHSPYVCNSREGSWQKLKVGAPCS